MRLVYVSAVDGSDADDGLSWANAKQTIAGAIAIYAAGDVILWDHAGTFNAGAGITWTLPNGYLPIISVNRSSGDAWTAGAKESTNGNFAFTITNADLSNLFVFGGTIEAGAGGNSATATINIGLAAVNSGLHRFESCTFRQNSTNASSVMNLGASTNSSLRQTRIEMLGCTYVLQANANATGVIRIGSADVDIRDPTISFIGTKPTVLFTVPAQTAAFVRARISGDLSGFNETANSLLNVANLAAGSVIFAGCKLHANTSLTTGSFPTNQSHVLARNCASGDTLIDFIHKNRLGTTTATSSIYAANGAEIAGVPVGWQVVTTAACDEASPYRVPALRRWNGTTGARTARVEFVKDGATDLTDREIFLRVRHPNSASFPSQGQVTDRGANTFSASAGTDQPNSSETWTGTGGFGAEDKQYSDVALTAAEVGLLEANLFCAKPSTTFYVDPLLRLDDDTEAQAIAYLDDGAIALSGGGGSGRTSGAGMHGGFNA